MFHMSVLGDAGGPQAEFIPDGVVAAALAPSIQQRHQRHREHHQGRGGEERDGGVVHGGQPRVARHRLGMVLVVIAVLVAAGETIVHDGEHIERGYSDLA